MFYYKSNPHIWKLKKVKNSICGGGADLDKEREKNVKKRLKQWGGENDAWLKTKNNEYGRYISLYEKGEADSLVSDKVLFEYREGAESVFREVRESMSRKSRMDEAVNSLDPLEQAVIVLRYSKKVKWEALPAHMPVMISLRQCYRLHKDSLEKIAEYLNI